MSRIGTNSNTSDVATISDSITVGSSVSTPIYTTTKRTLRVVVTNAGNKDVFIKLQSASVDNDKKGMKLYKRSTADVMIAPNVYIGEISAIATSESSELYVTGY